MTGLQEPGSAESPTRQGAPFRSLGWAFPLFGLLLAAFLVARGQFVLGAVIAGLAVVRFVFVLLMVRRRRAFAYAGVSGPTRELLRSLIRGEFEAAASAIGVEPDELRRGFASGRSVAESAVAAGVPVDSVVDAIIKYALRRIDELVAEKAVSDSTAAQAKERLPLWTARFVERRGDGTRPQRWRYNPSPH